MTDLFYPVDLGDWIELCQRAGVPFVPADEVARVSTLEVENFESPTPDVIGFWQAVRKQQETCWSNHMLRWSCCSMGLVKERLSNGHHQWTESLMDLSVDDFRAGDIIGDFARPTIAAYIRPWLDLATVDGYPVEYRAFVRDNVLIGISSYYPQRPLPADKDVNIDLAGVAAMTQALINAQTKPLLLPSLQSEMDLSKNQFTADFARTLDGHLYFLEGGPPHGRIWGAHPCCFKDGETRGLALEDRNVAV